MNFFSPLILFITILGVSAASGLQYNHNNLFVIGDSSPYLYEYNIKEKKLEKFLLDSSQSLVVIDKKHKPDFEAICDLDSMLMIIGSGSGPKRMNGYLIKKETREVHKVPLHSLYHNMMDLGGLKKGNLNIEGLGYKNGKWYFLNRGNGNQHKNLVFSIEGDACFNLKNTTLAFKEVNLPSIEGCPAGFSDGVIIEDKLFFLATREDKSSTYEDGENKGTFISYISLSNGQLGPVKQLSQDKKLEGLSVFKQKKKSIVFFICEDPDNEAIKESPIYTYRFRL